MNSLVVETESKPSQKSRVEELQRALQEAELEESIAMIHGVEIEEKGKAATMLGPTLVADLTIEGAPVQALIDTGSLYQ